MSILAELEAHRRQSRVFESYLEQRLLQEMDQFRAELGFFASASVSRGGPAMPGQAYIKDKAHQYAVEMFGADSEEAALIQEGTESTLAKAYDKVGLAKKIARTFSKSTDLHKELLIFLRDLLILLVCSGATVGWTNDRLELAFNQVFGRDLESLSQFLLSFNTIHRSGQNRGTHLTQVKKVYGEVDPTIMDQLWIAFRGIYLGSPKYISKTKSDSKGKRRPRSNKHVAADAFQQGVDIAVIAEEEEEEEEEGREDDGGDGESILDYAVQYAVETSHAYMLEPSWITVNQPEQDDEAA